MPSSAEAIISSLSTAAQCYHRLVLVVGPAGAGKTAALREVGEATGAPVINLGQELSERLLSLPERQRSLRVLRLLDEIAGPVSDQPLLLDNTEVLFEPELQQEPLQVLQRLSRNRTVVASWNGRVTDGHLTYALPGHPEERRHSTADLLLVALPSA